MAKALIVSANFGGYDEVRPQVAQDIDVEWRLVTDDPKLEAPEPWNVVVEKPRWPNPCLSAKIPKFLAPRTSIWIDANMEVISPSFAREALDCVHDGVALFRHPRRDCIYAECEASLGAESQDGKYEGQPLREQVASYRAGGHPERWGLYACGTIAWDGANPRLGTQWLAECVRWSVQDQLSFPVVCRKLGIEPGVFPLQQIEVKRPGWLENRWLRIHPHR